MGDGSQIGDAVGAGLDLIVDTAVAGAVVKGVSNLASEMATPGTRKKGFEGIKPMKLMKVNVPKVPKMGQEFKAKYPKIKLTGKGKIPVVKGPEKFVPKTSDIKKFIPKMEKLAPKPFKISRK